MLRSPATIRVAIRAGIAMQAGIGMTGIFGLGLEFDLTFGI
jgi:hypothetical protein